MFGRGSMPAERLRLVASQDRSEESETRGKPGDRIRRGTLSEPPLAASDDLVDRRLAEEIDYARRLLLARGERLVSDATVVARHSSMPQSFDVVAQMLGHLGSVVGAADREAAIDRIGMADLRGRIRRRSLTDEALVPGD